MRKWQFDQDTIKDAIESGKRYLIDNSLSDEYKLEIIDDIYRFKKFLDGDFELTHKIKKLSKVELKDNILKTMKKHYKLFNKNLINWLVGLEQSQIFCSGEEVPAFSLSIDDAANYTLQNYKQNSPIFYNYAYELLKNKKIHLIHETPLYSTSYCFFSSILQIPFIVVGSNDEASSLNHEIQHGIEYFLGIVNNPFYNEFGPIYFESMFNDNLYNQYGGPALAGTLNRIYDTNKFLEIAKCYFYAMNIFAVHNFEINEDLFFETFQCITNLSDDKLIDFLNNEIVEDEITEILCYLFSFLKAIEIRRLEHNHNFEARYKFNQLLYGQRFRFKTPKDGFQIYKDFVDEIKTKTR